MWMVYRLLWASSTNGSQNDSWSSKIATRFCSALRSSVRFSSNELCARSDTIVDYYYYFIIIVCKWNEREHDEHKVNRARTSNRRQMRDSNNRNRKTDTQMLTVRQTEHDRIPWMCFHSSKLLSIWMASEWRKRSTHTHIGNGSSSYASPLFFRARKGKLCGRVYSRRLACLIFSFCLLPFRMHRKAHAHTKITKMGNGAHKQKAKSVEGIFTCGKRMANEK